MKSVNLAIAATLLAISASSVQADTGTPNILSSVSANSVETLSNADASKTRGEYRQCIGSWRVKYCRTIYSPKRLSQYSSWHSSRRYLGRYKVGTWLIKKLYVAR
jgi:hypothetical protein